MATNDNLDKKNGSRKHHRLLAYFHDDQIVFLVTHEDKTISDDLLKTFNAAVLPHFLAGGTVEVLPQRFSFPAVEKGEQRLDELRRRDRALKESEGRKRQEALNQLESDLKKKDKLNPLHQFLLSNDYVPSAYQPEPFLSAFSLLVFTLKKPPEDPYSLLINVLKLRTAWKGKEIKIKSVNPQREFETLKIEDISPNWSMSVASNGSGTGGPGGLPRPFQGADADAKYEFDIMERLGQSYDEGENVEIAVLDTAPCPHTLAHAPKQWPNNTLIQGLLGLNGKLSLYQATLEDLQRMDNASLNRHDYEMPDHGLFVAGIAHSIVPKAKIHLIEVLNQWGVGDVTSLAAGLRKAFEQIHQPIVGICSWMLDLVIVGEHCAPIDSTDPEHDFQEAILHFVLKDREQASAIWAICNSISLAGGQVVAAAGNDWGSSKKHKVKKGILSAGAGGKTQEPRGNAPEARYPAGFVSVIGVGAIPKDAKIAGTTRYRASDYSNLGDKPEVRGIMTLGGEEEDEVTGQGTSQKEAPKMIKGVLGLYLSETYPVEVNPDPTKYKREFIKKTRDMNKENNPYGLWSGTSFATPIVAGTIASQLSRAAKSGNIAQIKVSELVQTLYDSGIIQNNATEAGEDVMEVIQGDKTETA